MLQLLHEQREKFIATYGREPSPGDEVFFDLPPAEELTKQIAEVMRVAGLREELIYAYEKTDGLLVTEDNKDFISEAELHSWYAAIDEFRRLHGDARD